MNQPLFSLMYQQIATASWLIKMNKMPQRISCLTKLMILMQKFVTNLTTRTTVKRKMTLIRTNLILLMTLARKMGLILINSRQEDNQAVSVALSTTEQIISLQKWKDKPIEELPTEQGITTNGMFAKAVISSPHIPELHTKEKEASHKALENVKTLCFLWQCKWWANFLWSCKYNLGYRWPRKKGAYRIFI